MATDGVEQAVKEYVDHHYKLFEADIETLGDPTGYLSFIQIVQHELEKFFVSDLEPGELYVSATVWAELELEVEYEGSRRRRYDDDERRILRTKCICLCVRMEIQLEVQAEDVTRVSVGSMERA